MGEERAKKKRAPSRKENIQAEERAQHLAAVLRAIRSTEQLIIKEKDRDKLLEGVCRNLIETRGYYNAWIAIMDENGQLAASAEAGLGEAFQAMFEWLSGGKLTKCARKALGQPGVNIIEDPPTHCEDCPLSDQYGGRGGMTVRLEHGGKVFGLLSVSIPEDFIKIEEEQTLFAEVAGDVAFALHSIEAEEQRRRAEQQVQRLSSKLLQRLEDERKLLAQEIHDSVGASLAAVKYSLEESLEALSEPSPAETHSLERIISMVQNAIEETRRISTNLRPSILDDLGILMTIRWFCREFERIYSSIHIEKRIDIEEDEVPHPLKIVLYRIVQEALTNVAKHSGAKLVRLSLGKKGNRIELSIEDTGCGFALDEVLSDNKLTRGIGLASMRERAELSGGEFHIESRKGKGTRIRAAWSVG